MEERALGRKLIDGWPVPWPGNRFPFSTGRFKPGRFGKLDFTDSFRGSRAESRTKLEVRNVGDVAAILFTIENVDMIVFHASSPRSRLYGSQTLQPMSPAR